MILVIVLVCVTASLFLVSNVLLLSSATVMSIRADGCFWLKPVAVVLFMVCYAVLSVCDVWKYCLLWYLREVK